MEHIIRQYTLEPGALEVQYIEECFSEFKGKKTAEEIVERLKDREHLILLSMAPTEDDDGVLIPVSYKIGHELKSTEANIKLSELVHQLRGTAGDRQVPNDPRVALAQLYGSPGTAAVAILSK